MPNDFTFRPSKGKLPASIWDYDYPTIPSDVECLDQTILKNAFVLSISASADSLYQIQTALGKAHPDLLQADLDRYDSAARGLRDQCQHNALRFILAKGIDDARFEDWQTLILVKLPWISTTDLSRIFSRASQHAFHISRGA